LVLGLATAFGCWQYGSLESALANLKGEQASVEPFLYDVGLCNQLEKKEITVRVVNHMSQPIRIVGQVPDCSYKMKSALPIAIQAHDSAEVQFAGVLASNEGMFSQEVVMFIDVGHLDKLRFRVVGRIDQSNPRTKGDRK